MVEQLNSYILDVVNIYLFMYVFFTVIKIMYLTNGDVGGTRETWHFSCPLPCHRTLR